MGLKQKDIYFLTSIVVVFAIFFTFLILGLYLCHRRRQRKLQRMREKAARTVITRKPNLITAGVLPSRRTDVILSVYGEENFAKLAENPEKPVGTFKDNDETPPKSRKEKAKSCSGENICNMKPTDKIQSWEDGNMNMSFAYTESQT